MVRQNATEIPVRQNDNNTIANSGSYIIVIKTCVYVYTELSHVVTLISLAITKLLSVCYCDGAIEPDFALGTPCKTSETLGKAGVSHFIYFSCQLCGSMTCMHYIKWPSVRSHDCCYGNFCCCCFVGASGGCSCSCACPCSCGCRRFLKLFEVVVLWL